MVALVLLPLAACMDDPPELVRKTIGPAGGLVSSHDGVLTLVFVPGALTSGQEIEIFPSDEPPPVFGPAYRVKPDIELEVNVEVTYRRTLPDNTSAVAVSTIRLNDYTEDMGHWVALPRLHLDEESGTVFGSDPELSLYYGLVGGSASQLADLDVDSVVDEDAPLDAELLDLGSDELLDNDEPSPLTTPP